MKTRVEITYVIQHDNDEEYEDTVSELVAFAKVQQDNIDEVDVGVGETEDE